jgi:quinoprotein glucose dehydrogenase
MALLLPFTFLFSCNNPGKQYKTWGKYKGSDESINYSSLNQVDTNNVKALEVAWVYHTGDADTVNHSQIQCNSIIVNGVLYGTSAKLKLFAIDAATGKQKWVFNPFDTLGANKRMFFILNNSRGTRHWTDGKGDERIYYTAGSFLYAINALSGAPVAAFGADGKIDLHDGLGRDVADLFITATSPPIIYEDVLIIGSRVDEGPCLRRLAIYGLTMSEPGKLRWIFHTIPHPGEERLYLMGPAGCL